MTAIPKVISTTKVFGGTLTKYEHQSETLQCTMKFNVFIPPAKKPVPLLYWLSGLTCTEDNFMQKAGAFKALVDHGLALITPDTSPRGLSLPGENDSWDFGSGAGFYVDATEEPWSKHYKMASYITKELPALVSSAFSQHIDASNCSIFGHSMGGHGALVTYLRSPGMYKSVSAFAPICHPTECQWGVKAFTGYLGANKDHWKRYDATELVSTFSGADFSILIDQGSEDSFLVNENQLRPNDFVEAVKKLNNKKPGAVNLQYRLQDGYDHSYYFISTFIADHIAFHAKFLK